MAEEITVKNDAPLVELKRKKLFDKHREYRGDR